MPIHLEIVTPERKVFSDIVAHVYLPGADGELGILPQHAALVTSLAPGELRYDHNGQQFQLAIGSGFAEVSDNRVAVLTDMALESDKIDEAACDAAIARAQERLSQICHSDDAEEVAYLQGMISKSLAQLSVKRKYRH